MTAEEKAKELVEKFLPYCGEDKSFDRENAKQCALICVDEIYTQLIGVREFKYWGEVKSELSSL